MRRRGGPESTTSAMRTACWNCQGFGNDPTVRRLKEISKQYLLDIICLSETKQGDDYMRQKGCELGFSNHVIVSPNGRSGGLVVYWKSHVHISLCFQSPNLADLYVNSNEGDFYLSFVYGHTNPSLRNHLWERLERIHTQRKDLPWLIMGDFNELLGNSEKKGGRARPESSFRDLRRMVRTCNFTDLKSSGDRFSWAGQRGQHHVMCCLDRTMANVEWFSRFQFAETEFLDFGESDHRPLVTSFSNQRMEKRGFFRYDGRLLDRDGFRDMVKQDWKGQGLARDQNISIIHRLHQCRRGISKWKQRHRSNASERIKIIRWHLNKAIATGNSTPSERAQLKRDLNQAYLDEEIYWKLKSRNKWLNFGDRNTKYFHSTTKIRRDRNRLFSIEDEDGVAHRGDQNIAEIAIKYFEGVYTTRPAPDSSFIEVFQNFPRRITDEINEHLTREVTMEEIRESVFAVGPTKAPGPDGFTGAFYQQFWNVISPEIYKEVQGFFTGQVFDKTHNHTNICLLPKVVAPTSMSDFRPIALCNVSYKIISKILVNRLKKHLSGAVSENQAAFIPGRMITNNITIAHEIFHTLKARKHQAKYYMALKTDIAKAYDRLEWSFWKPQCIIWVLIKDGYPG